MNQITHWIDASNVYGSTEHEIELLRLHRDGLLVEATEMSADLLPKCNQNTAFEETSMDSSVEVGLEACHGPCDHDTGRTGDACFAAGIVGWDFAQTFSQIQWRLIQT